MGFFARVKAGTISRELIELVGSEYNRLQQQKPSAEPHEIMAAVWYANFANVGKMAIAVGGGDIVKMYGCLPGPQCVRMMALHMCMITVPSFADTVLAREWEQTMAEIGALYSSCNADRLNTLFRASNPKSYESFVAETGRPPFDRDTMTHNRDYRERLGIS